MKKSPYKRGIVEIAPANTPNRNCLRDTHKEGKLHNTYIQKNKGIKSNTPEHRMIKIFPNTNIYKINITTY